MTQHDELRLLVDRQSIRDLHMRYFMSVDRREWELVKQCFVPGTPVDYSAMMPIDAAAPAEEVVDRIAAAIDEHYRVTVHNVGNMEVHVDGDEATSELCIVAHHVYKDPDRQDGRLPVAGIRYRDALVRTHEGWRIRDRAVTTDWRAWWEARGATYVDGRHQ